MSHHTASTASSEENAPTENVYCIFLHISEGVGLQRSRGGAVCQHDQILMHAQLNSVKFEIEGHSTEAATIFNSNCVWETSLNDLKRMRTDNRPVRISCYLDKRGNDNPAMKLIGTLLLPIRGLATINSLNEFQPKMLWHKLGALNTEWRSYKPEIYLLIIIAKKTLVMNNNFSALLRKPIQPRSSRSSLETIGMLQSQSNVYVQLIEQLGLIQVGNNPDVDCDIYLVVLTLKRIKDLNALFEIEQAQNTSSKFAFQYELFGNVTHDEFDTDETDNYALNQKIAIKFKTSMASMRLYFQRIFYIPIVIYFSGHAIATYRFDCSKFLPDISLEDCGKNWCKNGTFFFDRLHKILSPRSKKPSVEFSFGIELQESYSKKNIREIVLLRNTFVPYKVDEGAAGDGTTHSSAMNCNPFSSKILNTVRSESKTLIDNERPYINQALKTTNVCVDTNDLCTYENASIDTDELVSTRTIAINTEAKKVAAPKDVETVTVEMVKELEAWKSQQMQEFVEKLERKEMIYLRNIEEEWQKKHGALQQNLKAKNSECDLLKKQLDSMKLELEARTVNNLLIEKKEAERNFEQKIQQLQMDIHQWQAKFEHQKRTFKSEKEIREIEQKEKIKLEHENLVLKRNNSLLEQKLISLGRTHFSASQLKEMLADLRHQTERFADVEKQRNAYKEKLITTQRELQQLKLGMLKQQELTLLKSAKDSVGNLDFDEVFEDEKPVLSSRLRSKRVEPKIESKRIKEKILQQAAESGSSYDEELSSSTQ